MKNYTSSSSSKFTTWTFNFILISLVCILVLLAIVFELVNIELYTIYDALSLVKGG